MIEEAQVPDEPDKPEAGEYAGRGEGSEHAEGAEEEEQAERAGEAARAGEADRAEGVEGAGDPRSGLKPGRRKATPRGLVVTLLAVLAGVVGGTLAANTLVGSDGSAPMAVWMSDYGSNYVSLSHDVEKVNLDAAAPDVKLSALRADCIHLKSDVRTARGNPPMPDAKLEAPWSSIVGDLQGGAQSCVSGIDCRSDVLLQQAGRDFERAGTAYLQLVRQVDRPR